MLSASTAPSPSPYSHSAQLLQLIALPLRLLRFALSGRCSPFSGNLAITSLFILMSPSPHGNVANLKAVLGQKLISREISCGREACIFYEKGDRAIRMSANLLRAFGMPWRRTGERLGDRLWLDDGWEEKLQGNQGTITEELGRSCGRSGRDLREMDRETRLSHWRNVSWVAGTTHRTSVKRSIVSPFSILF